MKQFVIIVLSCFGKDAVVIDLGEKTEASILATSYCRKMGIEKIIVKAETEGRAEILELVGASKIVFPNREAAKRITPLMVSSSLLNYLPVSGKLVIAELEVPPRLFGTTLVEAELRKKYGINLISIKNGTAEEYGLVTPDYQFCQGDVALVSGPEEALTAFAGVSANDTESSKGFNLTKLGKLFSSGKK